MGKKYTYTTAQTAANSRTKKAVNRGWVNRVTPAIDATEEEIKKIVLGSYSVFGDEPANMADLQKSVQYKGVKMTRAKRLRGQITKSYRIGKTRVDQQVLGVSGGAYRSSAVQLNFITSITTSKKIDFPTKKQFFTAQNYPSGGVPIQQRQLFNTQAELDRMLKQVFGGISRGESVQEMAKTIEQTFDKVTRNNALRIVRTESARMMNNGNYDQTVKIRQAGIKTRRKIVSVLDDRTRPQSAQMDGQLENLDPDGITGHFVYPNGNTARFPGESGTAAYDINDRETVVQTKEGDDDPKTRTARNADGKSETIDYAEFSEWAKSRGLVKNRYGQILFP